MASSRSGSMPALSIGAEVGIAVGAAAGLIILSLIGACIFFKCRKQKGPCHCNDPEANSGATNDAAAKRKLKSNAAAKRLLKSNAAAKRLHKSNAAATQTSPAAQDDILLERVDDSQVRKYVRDLNGLILQHAENHYHGRRFESRPEDLTRDLLNCGYDERTTPSARALSGLLCNPATRRTAIRQLIVSVIIRQTEVRCDPETSLLPEDIARYCVSAFQGKSISDRAFYKSHSVRRALSAPVLHGPEASVSNASLRPGVTHTLQLLHSVLHHFIIAGAEHQRAHSENLSVIILEGARFGIFLFAQPSPWSFGWEAARQSQRSLVVFPSVSEVIMVGGEDQLRPVVDAVHADF